MTSSVICDAHIKQRLNANTLLGFVNAKRLYREMHGNLNSQILMAKKLSNH